MRRGALAALLLAVAVALAAPAGAATQNNAMRKVWRGFAGMTCGWLEAPGNVVKVSQERGIGWGISLGFVEGLGRIVVRELVGVYEFVTAPFPLPAGYQPILEPEYPWGYFDSKPAAR